MDSNQVVRIRGRRRRIPTRSIALPIVDAHFKIVGWTEQAPRVIGLFLQHDEAERLVGAIDASFVEIEDHESAVRAGAPVDWNGPGAVSRFAPLNSRRGEPLSG